RRGPDGGLPDLAVVGLRVWLRSRGWRVRGHLRHPQDARSTKSDPAGFLKRRVCLDSGQIARLLHIAFDLLDERVNVLEFLFRPEITDEAQLKIPAVNVAIEIEEVNFE